MLYITKYQPALCKQNEFYNLILFNLTDYTATNPNLVQGKNKKTLTNHSGKTFFLFLFLGFFFFFLLKLIYTSWFTCLSLCFSDEMWQKKGSFFRTYNVYSTQSYSNIIYTHTHTYIYIYIHTHTHTQKYILTYKVKKVKLVTIVEGDLKALLSMATTPRCRRGCYSFLWIAPFYPWSIPYNAEC